MSSALDDVAAAALLARRGVARPVRPDRALAMARGLARWGPTIGGWVAIASGRWGDHAAFVDDNGATGIGSLDARSTALAAGLRGLGLKDGEAAGLLMRNSTWFPLALAGLSKAGLDVVLLNTGSAAPQLAELCAGERVRAVVHDGEFADRLRGLPPAVQRIGADAKAPAPCLAGLFDASLSGASRPRHRSRLVILTSGTSGVPKGAPRSFGLTDVLEPAAGFLAAVPLRVRETTVIAAPLFHAWGLAQFGFGLLLGSTLVVARRFDPEGTLRLLADHRATALVAVPVMLARMLDLPTAVLRRYDLSALRVVLTSGSALPGGFATRFQDAFGDVLHNLYGTTEGGFATLATPADLRADPTTAGRPLWGTRVRIVGPDGRDVPRGGSGRIFVGNPLTFSGYTGGGDRERIADRTGDLVGTGDLGRLDPAGRLIVEGRDDEMVVSGGENVHPAAVENLLANHPDVAEVAVVGVADPAMGERLAAYVVRRRDTDTDTDKLDQEAVRGYVRDRLARSAVPRDVLFVDALPRNDTGKVVKHLLRPGRSAR